MQFRRRNFLALSAKAGGLLVFGETPVLTLLAAGDAKLISTDKQGVPPELIPAPDDPGQ